MPTRLLSPVPPCFTRRHTGCFVVVGGGFQASRPPPFPVCVCHFRRSHAHSARARMLQRAVRGLAHKVALFGHVGRGLGGFLWRSVCRFQTATLQACCPACRGLVFPPSPPLASSHTCCVFSPASTCSVLAGGVVPPGRQVAAAVRGVCAPYWSVQEHTRPMPAACNPLAPILAAAPQV